MAKKKRQRHRKRIYSKTNGSKTETACRLFRIREIDNEVLIGSPNFKFG